MSQESLYSSLGLDPSLVTHHEDGSISYDGYVDWDNKPFKVFPLRFWKITGYFSCSDCTGLVSLEGAPQEVGRSFYCSGCTSLVSLEGGPPKVGGHFSCAGCTSLVSLEGAPQEATDLALDDTPIYVIPESIVITGAVWLDGPNDWVPTEEARKMLQDFKSSITSDEDAAIILLDRANRPLWQVAYATDYLNRDIHE